MSLTLNKVNWFCCLSIIIMNINLASGSSLPLIISLDTLMYVHIFMHMFN